MLFGHINAPVNQTILWFSVRSNFLRFLLVTAPLAEVLATERCIEKSLDRNYRGQSIVIMSDSQAAIRALKLMVRVS